jgi:hypothetical protein
MKRKSELRCIPLNLQLSKCPIKINLFGVQKLQPFFPPIECLFKTENLERSSEYGFKLPETITSIQDSVILTSLGNKIEVHPKITMLLNPYKWMKGDVCSIDLPCSSEKSKIIQTKLQNHNNAAYVGSIFSLVFSLSECQHFPNVYGIYSGISDKFILDISDDYEELSEKPWFSKNIGNTFELKLNEIKENFIKYTRSARLPLSLGEELQLDDVEELEGIESSDVISGEFTKIFEETEDNQSHTSSSESTIDVFELQSVSEYSNYENDDEFDDDDEPFAWATFKNVPTQITIMEKLEGTFYELITKHPEQEKHFAWLGQIVFALAYAQRNFGFIHNDLHGNNIMFKKTNEEYFYYSYSNKRFKIPSYGYLLKIIDFDRGIGQIKLPGMKEPKIFMSDQFAREEEAGGQYNYEPFHTDKFSLIKPNPSFDLTRLATSLFWDMFSEGPEHSEYQNQKVFKLFIKWMTLPDNTSVLFHKKNPKYDRYYGFDLYKAIARYSNNAIPRKEISEFSDFLNNNDLNEKYLIIEV